MNIFIIGGTGFLGSHLIPRLISDHQITILTRNLQKGNLLTQQGVRVVVGDLNEMDRISGKVEKQDLVIYLAMPTIRMGRNTKTDIIKLADVIKKYLINTVSFVKEQKCPIIFTLGTSYQTREGEIADETWPIQRFGMTLAGQYFDRLLLELENEGEIPVIQVIPGQIYGPGGLFLKIIKMADRGRYVVFGNGKNKIPRIHVEDCAEGYACIVKKMPLGEKFILSDDYPCTTLEFNGFLYELLSGKKIKPTKIPTFLLRLILGKYVADTMMMDCVVNNQKAKEQLGWTLTYPSYKEGLQATVKAYRKGVN